MTKADRLPYLVKVPGRDAWHIRDGKSRPSTGETSKSKAMVFLMSYIEKRSAKSRVGVTNLETIGDVINYWVSVKRPGFEKNGMWNKKWKFVVGTMMRHAEDVLLDQAGFMWSRTYTEARKGEGVGDQSIRQELSTIGAAWRLAHAHEQTNKAPKAIDLPKAGKPRERWLTRDEAKKLIENCKLPHIALFVELCIATAGRHSAILELQWYQIHFKKNHVDLRVSLDADSGDKKRRAMVPVSARVMELLKEAKEMSVTGYVIEYRGGNPSSCLRGVKAAAERAELIGVVTPHTLRHTSCTWMCQRGVSLFKVAGFMGHSSTKQIEQTYGHHSPDHMNEARDALDPECMDEAVDMLEA